MFKCIQCHKRACPLQARAELRSNPAYVLPHAEVLLREAHDPAPATEPRQQPAPGVLQALRLRMQRKAIAWDLLIEVQRQGAVRTCVGYDFLCEMEHEAEQKELAGSSN